MRFHASEELRSNATSAVPIAPGDSAGTSTPAPSASNSGAAPMGTPITGVRQAIDSRIGNPKLSSREAKSHASQRA